MTNLYNEIRVYDDKTYINDGNSVTCLYYKTSCLLNRKGKKSASLKVGNVRCQWEILKLW